MVACTARESAISSKARRFGPSPLAASNMENSFSTSRCCCFSILIAFICDLSSVGVNPENRHGIAARQGSLEADDDLAEVIALAQAVVRFVRGLEREQAI